MGPRRNHDGIGYGIGMPTLPHLLSATFSIRLGMFSRSTSLGDLEEVQLFPTMAQVQLVQTLMMQVQLGQGVTMEFN